MKKLLLPTILIFAICFQTNAQEKSSKEKLGDKLSFSYSYSKAIDAYSDSKSLSTEGQRRLAMAYHKMDNNQAADSVYANYVATAIDIIADDYFNYAMSLKINGKYPESVSWMDKFSQTKPSDLRAKDYESNKLEYSKWMKDNGIFKVEAQELNTNHVDFGPCYFKDKIVFASSRNTGVFKKDDQWMNQPYLDMYVAEINEGQLKNPINFDRNLNGKMHDGPATFNKEGTTMAFTRNNYHDKSIDRVVELQIFFSNFEDNKWTLPVPFSYNNSAYSVGHPCFSSNGKTMYFVSDMPGGFGGSDLYVTNKDMNGTWSIPLNLGDKVNTESDELFPFYEENSMMLFFASDGRYGLGGLDIFICEMRDNQVGHVVNAGTPLNSRFDDISAIANDKMTKGFFASNRTGGKGLDDLYSFTIANMNKTKMIQGMVMQKTGLRIPKSFVKLFDDKNIAIDSMITNNDGEFSFKVESGKNFQLIGSKEFYLDGNSFATTVGNDYIVRADIILLKKPIEVQMKENPNLTEILELNAIYFDLDKSNIRPDAKIELDKIVNIMNKYPNLEVALSSYTDCRASVKYNQLLSERRAKSTVIYLKKKISNPKRITGKGYGETMFSKACPCENNAISDCTDEEYQKERNAVFTIVKQ